MDARAMLAMMVQRGSSDLFLKVGAKAHLRVAGKLEPIGDAPLTAKDMEGVFESVIDDRSRGLFERHGEADLAHDLSGVGRFRVNVFRQQGNVGFVFRYIASNIPSMEDLLLPAKTLRRLAELHRGLVLVTGVAGSGKSTTIATMVQYMNATLRRHIVTVEDPVEFLFVDQLCVVDQREVGIDTADFASALKHCVRQSPDVIFIGEMRDRETMEAALNAAETGHLVLSTLHTVNAIQTVERIMNMFPPHQHPFLQQQLSMLLAGVISQRLVPTKDGRQRVPAVEILASTPTVRELIDQGKFRELYKAIKEGSYYGTQTFNMSLIELYKTDRVNLEDALSAADNPDELKLEVRGIVRGSRAGDFDFKL